MLLFRYGFCLSKSYLENPRKLLCYFWWRRLQIRVSVTVQVWFMPINKSLLISDEGVYKLGLVYRSGMAYVISDEGAYRLGLVLLFGNGLYLPIYLQKSHVFSDKGVYKSGLVLLFRYGLCLSTSYLETPRKLLYNSSDEGAYKLGLVLLLRCGLCLSINPFYLQWRRLQIRVSVTVQVWLMLFLMKALTD